MATAAFTLVEVLVALGIMVLVLSATIPAFELANRTALWSSMSESAQAYAVQGVERARSAQWNYEQFPYTNGPGTQDELAPGTNSAAVNAVTPVFQEVDTNYLPQSGQIVLVTNSIYVTTNQSYPPLRQIKSVVIWHAPKNGRLFTNTVITLRAPDE